MTLHISLKKILLPLLAFFVILFAALPYLTSEEGTVIKEDGSQVFWGEVLKDATDPATHTEIRVTSGSLKDTTISLTPAQTTRAEPPILREGDKIMLIQYSNEEIYIADHSRSATLFLLFSIFALVAILIARWQGVTALLGMGYSFVIIFTITLPQLLAGESPLLIALLTATLIAPVTFYLSHGIHKKTHVAIIGTLLTLSITALLALIFISTAHLTGLSSEEAGFLQSETTKLNFKSLLLAGIIISVLGILDDITISQASVVNQLKKVQPHISRKALYLQAMSIGKDHIASMINTLILIYTGASLPLLMLFLSNNHSFAEVINYEFLAEEIIQTLIGSTGLILAVPITTLIATLLIQKPEKDIDTHVHCGGH